MVKEMKRTEMDKDLKLLTNVLATTHIRVYKQSIDEKASLCRREVYGTAVDTVTTWMHLEPVKAHTEGLRTVLKGCTDELLAHELIVLMCRFWESKFPKEKNEQDLSGFDDY